MKVAALFSLVLLASGAAVPADAQDRTGPRTDEAAQDELSDKEYLRWFVLPEDEIQAAVAPYAVSPVLEAVAYYPQVAQSFNDGPEFDAAVAQSEAILQEAVESEMARFRTLLDADIGSRFTQQELGSLAALAREREAVLRPEFAAIMVAQLTGTDVTRLRGDSSVANILSELRSAGGQKLLDLHRAAAMSFPVLLETRKDATFGRMSKAVLAVAESEVGPISSAEDLRLAAERRPVLNQIFERLYLSEEESRGLVMTSAETSFDIIEKSAPDMAQLFAANPGMRSFLQEKLASRGIENMRVERELARIGFVNRMDGLVDDVQARRVLDFLTSPLAEKLLAAPTADATRSLVTDLIRNQMDSSNLEQASEASAASYEDWVAATEWDFPMNAQEEQAFDDFFASPAGEAYYGMREDLDFFAAVQQQYAMLRYFPRNTIFMQMDIREFLSDRARPNDGNAVQ